jgi:hypothetical protein
MFQTTMPEKTGQWTNYYPRNSLNWSTKNNDSYLNVSLNNFVICLEINSDFYDPLYEKVTKIRNKQVAFLC